MSKLTTFYINSKNRTTGTISSFNINLYPLGLQNIKYFNIKNVVIPFSFYATVPPPITGILAYFTLNDSGFGPTNINVPMGNYSASQLIGVILPQLQVINALYTMTYSNTTGKFTIEAPGHLFDLIFLSNNAKYPYQSLGVTMGFNYQNYTSSTTYTSDNVANLSGGNLYIRCNALTYITSNFFNGVKDSVICTIPNTALPNGIITYEDQQQLNQNTDISQLSKLDFEIIDEYGHNIDLNGQDWNITICLYSDYN